MTAHRILSDPPHNDKRSSPELLRYLKDVQLATNNLTQGRTNNTGTVTLNANASTTTLNDNLLSGNRVVLLQATTADAAAVQGSIWFSGLTAGSVVINHTNDANVDKTFLYVILG